jgi:hypothetical protein
MVVFGDKFQKATTPMTAKNQETARQRQWFKHI